MATTSELRREIAGERSELTDAVASLREELGHTAERGRKVGIGIAAATAGAVALRLAARFVARLRR